MRIADVDLPGLLRRSPVPHALLVEGRAAFSVGRFWYQRLLGQYGYLRHRGRHDQNILFVAGLPKSGTSWIEGMLSSFRGYKSIMLPDAVRHELKHGGSHGYELSQNTLSRLQGGLYVLKLHLHGSRNNADLLESLGLRYAVMYRDLRDVAVSHYFYVRRTPWHPEHLDYRDLTVREGIDHFADTLLVSFAKWIKSWHRQADDDLAVFLRYEDLLDDAFAALVELVDHFGIGTQRSEIRQIQQEHSFSNVSGGRNRGEEDESSFTRKGVQGDWKNWFTTEQNERYRAMAGEALEAGGYL